MLEETESNFNGAMTGFLQKPTQKSTAATMNMNKTSIKAQHTLSMN